MFKVIVSIVLFTTFLLANTLAALFAPTQPIVKIIVTASAPNYKYPWQNEKIESFSGSGIMIEGKMILTSAHVVNNAKFIQVLKENDTKKYTARVKYISHQADLALLEVEDTHFFERYKPLKFTTSAKQGDTITVLGFPIGGATLSTTKGVVSRIERIRYAHSFEMMLAFQVDAAINPGNSGGAALNEKGEVVGVVMQLIPKASNIAYLVPSLIINTFLQDIKDGKVDGIHDVENTIQPLTNDALKAYYGVTQNHGVIVSHLSRAENELKLGDILLFIDGSPISHEGTIQTPYGGMNYHYLLQTKPVGHSILLKIIRDKKIITINYTLKRKHTMVRLEIGMNPRYLVYGGFIFSPLTANYLSANSLLASNFEYFFFDNCRTKHIKEPVVLQYEVLQHEINTGYQAQGDLVKSVNGVLVESFQHFVELIDKVDTPLTVIEFIDDDYKKIVLDTKKAKESFEDIKAIYGLSRDRELF